MVKIMLDPGHGGNDPGAVGNGLQEKNVVLDICKRIESKLKQYEGVEVRLTRTNDTFLTLTQRSALANQWRADYFTSVHINAGGGQGYEDFIFNGNVSAATVSRQTIMNAEVVKSTGFNNRGRKRANFAVLRTTNMPAILTECGFIDNTRDANNLKNPNFLDRIAEGHVQGFVRIFNLKRRAAAPTPATNSNTLFKVQTGAFSQRANAERMIQDLRSKGFDATLIIE